MTRDIYAAGFGLRGVPGQPGPGADVTGAEIAAARDAAVAAKTAAEAVGTTNDAIMRARALATPAPDNFAGALVASIADQVSAVNPAAFNAAVTAAAAGLNIVTAPDLTDTGYDVYLLAGQSNMQGDSGGSVSPVLDVTDPRIYVWGATGTYADQLAQASDPLPHRGSFGANATVVGPGMSFARWLVDTMPGNRRVLLIPAAYDGTAILSGTPKWDPNAAAGSSNLYTQSIAQANAALAAVPGARMAGVLWVQGESDALANQSAGSYQVALDQIIDGYRAAFGLPNLPFVIGSMTPEFVATYTAYTTAAIDAVHRATPARKSYTAFVQGPAGMGRGDNLHYSPAGHREQGRRLVGGLAAARKNVGQTLPFTDTFDRADSATTLGSAWAALGGLWGISGNQAYHPSNDGNGVAVVNVNVNDYTAAVKMAAAGDTGSALMWRVTDQTHWYAVLSDGSVYVRNGGAPSVIASLGSIASGSEIKVQATGSTFKVYVNGTQRGSTITNTVLATGKPGLRADTSASRFNDFTVTA